MSKIVIGKAGGHNVAIDLGILLSTRALLTSDSGGGKTWALKRIVEQAFGQIQILILDPEGEFSPLREHLDFVLVGKGGETPADIRSAGLVAQTLLKCRANAVCDLYEMKPSDRHIWVRDFCDGLLEAPKQYRHPCLVIVDEAHLFAPEHGKGESAASDAVIGLCTRGRKRLLVPLFATQRLATLSKDASSMLLNRMVGGTFEDVNRKRAADVLGIPTDKKSLQAFYDEIKTLEPGNFFCLGRAISKDRILAHIGPIKTAHGQEALKYEMKPPPATDKIKAMLPKLADLPKAAEDQARSVAELKQEIRSLKGQLRSQPQPKAERPVPQRGIDPRAIERAVRDVKAQAEKQLVTIHASEKALRAHGARLSKDLAALAQAAARTFGGKSAELPQIKLPIIPKFIPCRPATAAAPRPAVKASSNLAARSHHSDPAALDGLSRSQAAILRAIAEFEAIGRPQISKAWIAARAGASYTSSAFGNNLGFLRSGGYIVYPAPDQAALTEKGREAIGAIDPPGSSDEMLHSCLALLTSSQQAILKALYEAHPNPVRKDELAAQVRASATSSAYGNNLGALRSAGMIDYPGPGMAKCSDWLFID